MSLSALSEFLEPVPQYRLLRETFQKAQASGRVQLLPDATPFLLATLWKDLNVPVLVVTPRPEEAGRLHERLVAWTGDEGAIRHFPETETLPFERLVTDIDTVHQRLRALHALTTDIAPPPMVVSSALAVAQRTLDKTSFESAVHTLSVNDQIDLEDMLDGWRRMGYRFESAVYSPGVVSRRGGIVDVFPVGASMPAPYRSWPV